jgi:topoisomerase IA-like protein
MGPDVPSYGLLFECYPIQLLTDRKAKKKQKKTTKKQKQKQTNKQTNKKNAFIKSNNYYATFIFNPSAVYT